MNRRSILGKLGVALSAVLVWQAVFTAPAPVLADDPTSGTLIPCGSNYVCGITGTGPGSNIVVTGPEDRIIQTAASGPWAFLEEEAKGSVAAVHGVPVDSRLTDWGRDELRAYIFGRLLSIAAKPVNQRTTQEQGALRAFQDLVKQKQIESATNALNLYHSWDVDLCNFHWPSEATSTPNLYIDQTDVEIYCADPLAGLAGRPASPSSGDFTAMGTAKAFSKLASDPDGQRVQNEMITGSVFLGGMAAAAAAAGIAAAITFATPAIVAALVAGVFPFAAGAGASMTTAGALAFSGIAAASTVAAAIFGAVLIAVFGAIVIGIAIWQQVTQAEVPARLNATLNSVNQAAYLPEIANFAATDDGMGLLSSVFTLQTLPDYSNQRFGTPAAHGSQDPRFLVVQHNPNHTDTALGLGDAINPVGWTGGVQTAYMSDGWWVNDAFPGPQTYRLRVPIVTPDGEHWQAGVTKIKVAAAGIVPAHVEPSLVLEHDGHPNDTRLLQPGESFDYRGPVAGFTYTATLIPPSQNYAPLIKPSVEGDFEKGGTVSFHADAIDPNDNPNTATDEDPVTVTWLIEPGGQGPALIFVGNDGQSQIDHCYTNPYSPSYNLLGNCPWDVRTGTDPTYTYSHSGDLHVHVIATDSRGATASDVFQVHIGDVAPEVTMSDAQTDFPISEGGTVSLAGSANDPGDDQLKVTVDWGDGSSNNSQWFPCSGAYLFGDGIQCNTVQLPVPGAAHPTPFSFGPHTYADDPAGATPSYTITLTTRNLSGVTTKTFTASVTNVVPELSLGCGLTSDPGFLFTNPFGCQTRYGETGTSIPLNGFFDDPGTDSWTLDVNWGDGNTNQYTYPCPVGDPCPFQATSNVFLFLAQPGREFFGLTHSYASAGSFTISASVNDGDGGSDSAGAAAAISAPPIDLAPSAAITAPANNATYAVGQSVLASYSCADDHTVQSCSGPVAPGSAINTSTLGQHTFTVTAKDNANQSTTNTVHYTVIDNIKPTINLAGPTDGAIYALGQVVRAYYSCLDNVHVATCSGPVPNATPVDTASVGQKTLTITATDPSGNRQTKTIHYRVVYRFTWLSPLLAPNALNGRPAGSATQIRFSLFGSRGLPILGAAVGVAALNCATGAQAGAVQSAVVSQVRHDATYGFYYFNWTPPASYKGTCRNLLVTLKDGTVHTLRFKLR